jgi:DNA-binding HxlR family transcriptional regulator
VPSRRSSSSTDDAEAPAVEAVQRIGIECRLILIHHLQARPMRFRELQQIGSGIEGKTLSRVLRYLVREQIIEREVLATRPIAVEYRLTEKGRALAPVLDALGTWGKRWLPLERARDRPPTSSLR